MLCQPRNVELGRKSETLLPRPRGCDDNNLLFPPGALRLLSQGLKASRAFFSIPPSSRGHLVAKGLRLPNDLCFSLRSAGFKPSIIRLPRTKASPPPHPQPGFLKIIFPLELELTISWPKPGSCLYASELVCYWSSKLLLP